MVENLRRLVGRILGRLARMIPHRRLRIQVLHFVHLHFENCEIELKNISLLLPGMRRRAIDVGANIGHYSLEFSKHFQDVLAFEVNGALARDLERVRSNIKVENVGLSSSKGSATLYIPILRGLPLSGWASLKRGNCPDTNVHEEKKVRLETLDSYNFQDIDFVKIDVEGHELEVLKGGETTLRQNGPNLLIEIRSENFDAVAAFLRDLGYQSVTDWPLSAGNYFFSKYRQPGGGVAGRGSSESEGMAISRPAELGHGPKNTGGCLNDSAVGQSMAPKFTIRHNLRSPSQSKLMIICKW